MRLPSWFRRPAPQVGRHSRMPAQPLVPSAAATLVLQTGGELLDAVAAPAPAPQVTLGFSDGGSVVLDPDDPRVRTFRAAAEAIVDPRG